MLWDVNTLYQIKNSYDDGLGRTIQTGDHIEGKICEDLYLLQKGDTKYGAKMKKHSNATHLFG